MGARKWNLGAPPHMGWWNASIVRDHDVWRWWDGHCWSAHAFPWQKASEADYIAARKKSQQGIEWSSFWPRNARVPRIDPGATP